VALVLVVTACCGREIPPPDDAVEDAMELVNMMTARIDDIGSARFRVVSEYYGGELRGANFRQVVLVRQPADLHVQILSPFDQTLQVLVANDDALALYDYENETFYRGSPSPENIARLMPFYMTASDIVRVMLGGPPIDQMGYDPAEYVLEWDGEEGRYTLTVPLANEAGRLEMGVLHDHWVIASAKRFDGDGELVFELRTGDLETHGDTRLPMRLRFLLEGESPVDMSIEVESVELDVPLPDQLFVLEPPAGVEIVDL